jgi:hypothetical protein
MQKYRRLTATCCQTPFIFLPFKWTYKKTAHPEVLYAQDETPASRPVTVAYRDVDPLNDDGTLLKALSSFSFSVPPTFSSIPAFSWLVQFIQKWLDFFWHRGSDRQLLEGGADIAYSTGDNPI